MLLLAVPEAPALVSDVAGMFIVTEPDWSGTLYCNSCATLEHDCKQAMLMIIAKMDKKVSFFII